MKLRALIADSVHRYLNFKINFNDSLTFLIGPNGCGKSTALRLIEALISPSLEDLFLTRFKRAELLFEHKGEKRIIAEKNSEELLIQASWVEGELRLRDIGERDSAMMLGEPRAADEFFSKLAFEHSSNPVLQAIRDLPAPLFLRIDRRQRARSANDVHIYYDDVVVGPRTPSGARRVVRGEILEGLRGSQHLVREAYSEARRRQDLAQQELRSKVLLSIFEYSDSSPSRIQVPSSDDLEQMESATSAIAQALVGLGLSRREVEQKRTQFTGAVADLFRRMKDNEPPGEAHSPVIEYLMNQANLSRMQATIEVVQAFNERTKRIFGRIDKFQDALNWFFSDSRKKIYVDEVGRILVKLPNPDDNGVSLEHLSSGERQIIVIFSHVFFHRHGQHSKIFIIDEPELSLHARWQEHLVDKVLDASPNTQLIFATHSPDIVSAHDDNCVEMYT